jgi:transposase
VFLLDGASYHKSQDTIQHIVRLGLHIVITAPYSFDASPVELFFAYFKQSDINPECESTGKK